MAKKSKELSMEDKLRALYNLQRVYTEIDEIKVLRGELPLEVQDLDDEITGLQTRCEKYADEIKSLKERVSGMKIAIEESKALISKYTEQQLEVKNNREYTSLTKEIEFQTLEIQLNEKKIKETNIQLKQTEESAQGLKQIIAEKKENLEIKQKELEEIIAETQADEEARVALVKEIETNIDERLLKGFLGVRENARNGLAVVAVERDACGGCFNKIPPQRQMDIKMHKKMIVCEYCGRILVDPLLDEEFAKTVAAAQAAEEAEEGKKKAKPARKTAKKKEKKA